MAAILPHQLADKIAHAINANTWEPRFRAKTDFVPEYILAPDLRAADAPSLADLQVDVLPRKRKTDQIARGVLQRSYSFDLSFLKKLAGNTAKERKVELERLIALVQSVESFFSNLDTLPTHEDATIDTVETDPIYDPSRLRNDAEFASRIILSLQIEAYS